MTSTEVDWFDDAHAVVAVAVAFKETLNDSPGRDEVHVYHWDRQALTLVRKVGGVHQHQLVAHCASSQGLRLKVTDGAADVLEIFDRAGPPQFSPVFCPTSRRFIHCIGFYAVPGSEAMNSRESTLRLADETLEVAASYLEKRLFPDTVQGDFNFAVAMLGAIVEKLNANRVGTSQVSQGRVAPWLLERIIQTPHDTNQQRRVN